MIQTAKNQGFRTVWGVALASGKTGPELYEEFQTVSQDQINSEGLWDTADWLTYYDYKDKVDSGEIIHSPSPISSNVEEQYDRGSEAEALAIEATGIPMAITFAAEENKSIGEYMNNAVVAAPGLTARFLYHRAAMSSSMAYRATRPFPY